MAIAQVFKPRAALTRKENNIQSKIPLKVLELSFQFIGLSKEKIVKIFHNKFRLINLYQLCYMQRLSFEAIKTRNV